MTRFEVFEEILRKHEKRIENLEDEFKELKLKLK
jgi:hypothetical protein